LNIENTPINKEKEITKTKMEIEQYNNLKFYLITRQDSTVNKNDNYNSKQNTI